MNRTIRAIIGAAFILIIMFSAISICQNIRKSWKIDVTDQKLYTLSDGTKSILAKLNQPIKAKLFYAKTAALKGPDQIKYFNNYYEFVRALLEEYVAESKGMVELEIIDPRPFSDDEVTAMRYGLQQYRITEEENFFFGLVVQTQFGVEKVIPFFSPDRQNFIEYDISYLIDTAITRQKTRVGIMSSLPVMGDTMSPYMMPNQQPRRPWTFVEQLRERYQVESVPADVNEIPDIDFLLIIHPKNLPERTLFAIDQFVLKGGKTIVFVDPYCFADAPDQMAMQMGIQQSRSSELNVLLRTWGIEMPADTFAGDKTILARQERITGDMSSEKILGYLNLLPDIKKEDSITGCFNTNNAITAELNQVEVLFAGVLREVADSNQAQESSHIIERTPLIMTTNKGNSFTVSNQYEMRLTSELMREFIPGDKPITMGYLITGRFRSSFPDGIEIEIESQDPNDPNETIKSKKQIKGLADAQEDCAIVVFSDVDFIIDGIAYEVIFRNLMRIRGDNSALVLNTIDKLSGSTDLISIRTRGNFSRSFKVVDEIIKKAEQETAEEKAKYNMEITVLKRDLQSISTSESGEDGIVGDSKRQKKREILKKINEAELQLKNIRLKRRERTERLKNLLRNFNMLPGPAVVLVIAVALGIRRSVRKRRYISHASDA